jgi:DNA-binding FadR family transcriptional regulator
VAGASRVPVFDSSNVAARTIRTPKTAELVAKRLRRMIIDRELETGHHLPHEAELMTHFAVSRPTLREAVRVLESEGFLEARSGSRSGARIQMPGPEALARPASLLLQLRSATVADVIAAREVIEPAAARLVATEGTDSDFDELERMADQDVPAAYSADTLGAASARFHRRLVEMSGNATLSLIAGMLDEITERHMTVVTTHSNTFEVDRYRESYRLLVGSLRRLIELLRARDADEVFAHWHRHMVVSRGFMVREEVNVHICDILD